MQGSYSSLDFFISICKNSTYVSYGFIFHSPYLVKDTQHKKAESPYTCKTLLYPRQALNYWIIFLSNLKVNPFLINHLHISSICQYFYWLNSIHFSMIYLHFSHLTHLMNKNTRFFSVKEFPTSGHFWVLFAKTYQCDGKAFK